MLLKSRPKGWPTDENFLFVDTEISYPAKGSGEILVQTLWISVDPYLRGR